MKIQAHSRLYSNDEDIMEAGQEWVARLSDKTEDQGSGGF